MDNMKFDTLTKQVAQTTDRRSLAKGLGALALGSAGILGLSRTATAQVSAEGERRRCKNRCKDHCGDNLTNRECRRRCRRRCENR